MNLNFGRKINLKKMDKVTLKKKSLSVRISHTGQFFVALVN